LVRGLNHEVDYGFGLVGNIVVGIIGTFIAGWLLPRIGSVLVGVIVAEIVNAVIGAVILLLVIGFLKKAPKNWPLAASRQPNRDLFAALHESGSGTFRTCRDCRVESGFGDKAEVGFRARQGQLLAQSGRSWARLQPRSFNGTNRT
jgi:uncharacterized membrane protein YeaQ/YmgE (transglycosylase-associated protein family)